jgi:trypsin-like peptidase
MVSALAATVLAAISPLSAHASFQANEQELESLLGGGVLGGQMPAVQSGPSGGDLTQPAAPGGVGRQAPHGARPGGATSSQPPRAPRGKVTRRCYRLGSKRWVCRFYRGAVLYQRCRYTGARSPARRVGACTRAVPTSASTRAATPGSQGWVTPALPAVGKLFAFEGAQGSSCTGTAVSATLVLTAGHCVYDRASGRFYGPIFFAPGGSYAPAAGRAKMSFPYGLWRAGRMWTTTAYQQDGALGADWGLIEFGPEEGANLGARVGTYAVYFDVPWPLGARVYAVGYPASGAWRAPAYAEGRDQYACDSTYGGWRQEPGGAGLYLSCPMNGGASGGPWFRLQDGQWVVAGINNQCSPATTDTCSPYGTWVISSLFDSAFGTFWTGVAAQLGSA